MSDIYVSLSDLYVDVSENDQHDQEMNILLLKSVFATYCHLLIIMISDKLTKRSYKMIKGYNYHYFLYHYTWQVDICDKIIKGYNYCYFFFVLLYLRSWHLCVQQINIIIWQIDLSIIYVEWLDLYVFLCNSKVDLPEKYDDNWMAHTVHVHVFGLNFKTR